MPIKPEPDFLRQSIHEDSIRKMCQSLLTEPPQDAPSSSFQKELWNKAGQAGLMGIGLPESYGGHGDHLVSLSIALKIITETFRDTGFSLSFLIHALISRLILSFGTETQKNTWLPLLAKGQMTGSMAVSEPETGAHPKYLKTTANRFKDSFILNGQKAFITNGPMADFFIVIAVTRMSQTKKRFSALIVPKETPGLSQTQADVLPFFKTSLHGGIRLCDAQVPY